MATYLELVNKVIHESGSELDPLVEATWDSAEAGRRIYPRIKRNVADAWKKIQMSRDEWKFMSSRISTVIYPRIRFSDGSRATTPAAGAIYAGATSGASFEVVSVTIEAGTFLAGTAEGFMDIELIDGPAYAVGELFEEVSPSVGVGEFIYTGMGDYDFTEVNPDISDIQWATFTGATVNGYAYPIFYTPWDNWHYQTMGYSTRSASAPAHVTQDYAGRVVFYPSAFEPFRVSFVHDLVPQIFSEWDDEPTRIPEHYHDWIAWEALMMFAKYDKNPTLYAYANSEATPYKLEAERNLMPPMTYKPSRL